MSILTEDMTFLLFVLLIGGHLEHWPLVGFEKKAINKFQYSYSISRKSSNFQKTM